MGTGSMRPRHCQGTPPPEENEYQEGLRVLCCDKKIDGTPHIGATIEAFMGPPPRTTVQVCKLTAPKMLRQIIASVEREPKDTLLKLPAFLHWQFDQGMENAVVAGHLEMVKTLALSFPSYKVSVGVVITAITHARLEILLWLFTFRMNSEIEIDAAMVAIAVKSGDLEIVKWAYAQCTCKQSLRDTIDEACDRGHLDIPKWLLEHVETSVDLSRAAFCEHFHVVEWLLEHHLDKCTDIKWAAKELIRCGKVELTTSLLQRKGVDGDFSGKDSDVTARNGHLNAVKWLLTTTKRKRCTSKAMDEAAGNGHLEVVKWLHQNKTEGCTSIAMDSAAWSGHLEVVKWLHENRTEGCTTDCMDSAAGNGHLDVVKWLHQHRTEGCTTKAMNFAASSGYLEVVKWLHQRRAEGCTVRAMDNAAAHDHLKVVQWLHSSRREGCTIRAVDRAAKNDHLEVVKWLHDNRSEGCSTNAMDDALEMDSAMLCSGYMITSRMGAPLEQFIPRQCVDTSMLYGGFIRMGCGNLSATVSTTASGRMLLEKHHAAGPVQRDWRRFGKLDAAFPVLSGFVQEAGCPVG